MREEGALRNHCRLCIYESRTVDGLQSTVRKAEEY